MGCSANKEEKKKPPENGEVKDHPQRVSTEERQTELPTKRKMSREMTATSFSDIRKVYKFNPKAIGHGHFGSVRIAWLPNHPEMKFAVKTISKEKIKRDIHILRRELEILKSLSHPNIVKFYETYQDERFFHLVMELCTGGELLERVIKKGCLLEAEAARIMQKIFLAVAYLHVKGICHRDLKPENFLFSDLSDEAEVKVIDFGLANKFGGENSKGMSTVVGTAMYVAPEVLRGKYDHRCDNWSLGVMLHVLLSGRPPFYGETNQDIFRLVLNGKFSLEGSDWDRISSHAKDLITKLIVMDPEKRLTAAEALKHPWFAEQIERGMGANKGDAETDRIVIDRLKAYAFASRFKREALRLVAAVMSEKELKHLKEKFRAMDKDGTGLIHVSELEEVMRSCGYTDSQAEIRRLVEEMNYGEAEQINYMDFIAATLDERKFLTKEKLWAVFKHFDTDDTNYITKENLTETMARMGRKLPDEVIEEMVRTLDHNNDGKIYFQDFLQMMSFEQLDALDRDPNLAVETSFFSKSHISSNRLSGASSPVNPERKVEGVSDEIL
eukprot:TRINITY_DN5706_c0_g1_i1.p1 TRINITY_DN5706_c0_g1~~TRINITY_DN5706_c0_g1_i1.p1  ORF type:complete len:555 (+),score=107.49 TRINITY_DN5706_c0_g1_i1:55-1719(+)